MVPKRALEEPSKMSPRNVPPRAVHMGLGRTQGIHGETTESPLDGHDLPNIYTIGDQY